MRDDREFCSSHRLSCRFGTQCAAHTCLTLHISHTEHSHAVCAKPTADEASASPAEEWCQLMGKRPTKTVPVAVSLP